ncbi:sensor histidine kinase [Micromonospora polyrhachis]|uniref:histidine kinase n=1 Tax=Micromonospora polyrhachis TaxID=1282883 RepID=A0A7W7SR43_9ACTN|nr:sensor histidine kinase [Micromonospora polyrhachis]MBB4959286.1 signal transduction histidine kinase [Micromonospora polyrhachis]
MDVTPHLPSPSRWLRAPTVRATLRWCAALAFPFVLLAVTLSGASNPGGWSGLRYVLPALVLAMPFGLLRHRPLPTMALMLSAAVLVAFTVQSWEAGYLRDIRYLQFAGIDLAVGYLAATRSRRFSIAAAVIAFTVQAVTEAAQPIETRQWPGAIAQEPDLATQGLLYALAMVTAWLVGNSLRQRREHTEAVRLQAATQAVTAERLRIARELHDMVAHSIGIIAIQAGVGCRVIDTQPAEARNALSAIETTSRETLAGLRRMLGALRRADPESAAGPVPLDPVPLDPTPGLADVDRLAATATDAGVRVDVRWRGERRPLPAEIDLSAYRIVQEAVTNVVRHAHTGGCQVTVDYGDEELSVEIVDDGRGSAVGGTGYGIVGMRERVSLLHGQFTAGPRPEGGFRVAARLPLPTGDR